MFCFSTHVFGEKHEEVVEDVPKEVEASTKPDVAALSAKQKELEVLLERTRAKMKVCTM